MGPWVTINALWYYADHIEAALVFFGYQSIDLAGRARDTICAFGLLDHPARE